MRTPRKNSTYRNSRPVTSSKAKPADIMRIQAMNRGQRKFYNSPKVAITKLDDTTETFSGMVPDAVEDMVRAAQHDYDKRTRAAADSLWGSARGQ